MGGQAKPGDWLSQSLLWEKRANFSRRGASLIAPPGVRANWVEMRGELREAERRFVRIPPLVHPKAPLFFPFWILASFPAVLPLVGIAADDAVSFTRDIRPLLSDRCFQCHGPDEKNQKAGLRLDTKEGALAPLDDDGTIFTLVPGDLDKSELWYRITTDDEDDLMPPPDQAGLTLSADEKNLIRRWIEQGAEFEDLWSFVTPESPEPPVSGRSQKWARNPIDHFVFARLESEGLEPSPQADRHTLIRRLSYDLTGLPATPEEIESFVEDKSPDAYEKLVDRLLASDRYGERMAVEWLDAARYADTSGYQYDWPRTMWRWRDWVIDAYNDNLSYDQFITWQIAGDLLPEATLAQQIATGFNRNHPFTIEGGTIDEEYRVSYVSDRVTTMGTVFLGMTFECARCHDHKYDPVSQQDFYQLYAFFNQVDEKGRIGGKPAFAPPAVPAPTEAQAAELAAVVAKISSLRETESGDEAEQEAKQVAWAQAIPESAWEVVRPESFTSEGGASLELLEDESVLATGKNPGREIYTFRIPIESAGDALTGFRVEALLDESMTAKGGPGRSGNGNAVLTQVEASLVMPEKAEGLPLEIASAEADFEQDKYPVAHAIDGNPKSGWAFHASHQDHVAAFRLVEAAEVEPGAMLEVTLKFESGFAGHQFGRVRLAVSGSPEPSLEDAGSQFRVIADKAPAERTQEESKKLREAFLAATDPAWRKRQGEIRKLETQKAELEKAIPMTMIMNDAKPRETFILDRGAYDQQTERVEADTPSQLPPFPEGAPRNRLGLAQWLTMPENPLTARVTMNRTWHQIFGAGIVKTVNDFGSQAELPTHPDLLDWLAVEFVESGWDLKEMIKTIVTSATYRQQSETSPELMDRDPENRWLARGPRHRLSAEMLRDGTLAIGGRLVEEIGGPSVKPYQPAGLWKELTLRPGFMQTYEPDTGENGRRRSLYTFWKRAAHHPMMATFDAPNREVCTFSRGVTNTPLQALVLLHDPQFVEAARGLAQRILTEPPANAEDESRLRFAFLAATGRTPKPVEVQALSELLSEERDAFAGNPAEAESMIAIGNLPIPEGVDPANLAAWMMVARALLNLSEVVTKH